MEEETRNKRRGLVIAGLSTVLACIAVLTACYAVQFMLDEEYRRTHFEEGTYIQGVDCSDLTVEEAKERIEEKEVELSFTNGNTISVSWQEIGRYVNGTNELESFLEVQRSEGTKTFTLSENSILVNGTQTHKFLMGLEELKAENMQEGKDAYLKFGEDGFIEIVPEVIGNVIEFERAWEFVTEQLMCGSDRIFFVLITDKGVERFSSDPELVSKMDEINNALHTKIDFELTDGSFFSLDYEIISTWVHSEQDMYGLEISIDENLTAFLEELNLRVEALGKTMEFQTDKGDVVTLPVKYGNRNSIDMELEHEQVTSELKAGKSVSRKPNYSRLNLQENFNTYVAISLEEQRVRLYVNGEIIKDAPCITGDVTTGSGTPRGVFYPTVITTDYHMTLYECDVAFWVAFNGHIGMHDADNWRSDAEYVPTAYIGNGSHGCVNMLEDDIAVIFPYITYDTPIIVY